MEENDEGLEYLSLALSFQQKKEIGIYKFN